MALKISKVILPSDIEVDNSYARIQSFDGDKDGISVLLFYYKDQDSFLKGKAPFLQQHYSFVPSVAEDAANYHKQGYEYIKSLPDFFDAIDC
jgi:hypothetical protein